MTIEASRRGNGPGSNVKYLVDMMYGATHTLGRHACQPTDFRLAVEGIKLDLN